MDLFREIQDTIEHIPLVVEDETIAAPKKIVGNTDFFRKFTNQGTELKQLSNRDAANIIQQAHDDTEEIDTVAFGLETNEGDVVKVYVNAEQADDFEKAMADMLGQEDDIEEAIDKMAQSFDIVSVEWPEDRAGGAQPAPGEDQMPDNVVAPENEDAEDEQSGLLHKVKLNFNLNDKDEEGESEEDDSTDSEEDVGDEESDEEADIDFNADEESDSEDEDTEDETDSKDGKKKVKKTPKKGADSKKKVEEQLSLGARVRARFLKEDDTASIGTKKSTSDKDQLKKDEKDLNDESKKKEAPIAKKDTTIEDIFKTPMQRKLFRLVLLLDFPTQRLIANKQELRSGIRSTAIDILNNPKARLFLNKVIKELEASKDNSNISDLESKIVKAHKKEDLQEAKGDQQELLNKQIDIIIQVLTSLGVPEAAINVRETALKQSLRNVARLFLRHSKLQNYLNTLVKAFKRDEDKEQVTEEVALGASQYATLVSKLMSELGVPDDNLNYQRSTLSKSLRDKSLAINIAAVKPRLVQLIKLLAASGTEQVQEQLINEADIFVKQHASKLGNWSIARLDRRVTLSVENISIDLAPSQTERLVAAIEEGDSVTVKAGAQHYKFKAVNNGKEYVVFLLDSEEYDHGVLFPKSAVKTLLNQF